MRKVTLFIGMSLDGYIADNCGGVDWMAGEKAGMDDMTAYHEFISGIDTVVMGGKTYRQIATELSPGEWPYRDLEAYVITRRELSSKEAIQFTDKDVCALVRELQQKEGRGIWICGGAETAQQLIGEDLIDRYHICIMPILLGNGIRLFHGEKPTSNCASSKPRPTTELRILFTREETHLHF